MRYVPAHPHVRAERLADLTLVFHRLSGETHILSPEMEMIYSSIPDTGLGADDLLRALEARYGAVEADDGDAAGVLSQRLEELVSLGLLTRVQ